jgi:trehalose 6-phosphate synthase
LPVRGRQIRAELRDPDIVLLGLDRLDYTKGILHRLQAYEELLDGGRLGPPQAVFVQVASPSRERVEQYEMLREEVEGIVGRINGNPHPRAAGGALSAPLSRGDSRHHLAADVMIVTSLRDGMNLVAKEYVACHRRAPCAGAQRVHRRRGRAGRALLVNPHDIEGMKTAIVQATRVTPRESRRRMRSMRKRVRNYDVNRWASSFLNVLQTSPTLPPQPYASQLREDDRGCRTLPGVKADPRPGRPTGEQEDAFGPKRSPAVRPVGGANHDRRRLGRH